jgi:hypothetical protein
VRHQRLAALSLVGLAWGAGPAAAEAPRLREVRTQTVNGVTYFHARFDRPADLWLPARDREFSAASVRDDLPHLPRLVPQDDRTRDVVLHRSAPTDLGFAGRLAGTGRAQFIMFFSRAERLNDDPIGRRTDAVEVPVEIDFDRAQRLPEPTADGPGKSDLDLQSAWAAARATRFAVLEAMTTEFGFYGLARVAVQRKYGVTADPIRRSGQPPADRGERYRRVYETTTGAAAITESLQLERLLNPGARDDGPREIDISKVQGIDIAEHPWERMMAGQAPDPEPLARLVPHDNYFVHFQSFAKYVEARDFLDEWGTAANRVAAVRGRDDPLKERYEKQLCLKTTLIGRTLGPLVIRGVAMTGSDPYLREGSDLALVFQLADVRLFRASVESFIREARAEFGDQLREGREDYHGVAVESFVTPRREVSLYRAAFDDFMVYANSPVGLRRILDARAGRIKPLVDSLDFRYMRTVFRHTDPAEDGFVFLSDAFIRQLVGPASKIKEKRRLEALTGLAMATNAALYHAWDTGRPPADLAALLAAGGLKPSELLTPDQAAVTWDAARQVAVSSTYNTLHFATPLVELPIDHVTRREADEYGRFRQQYLGLWRQYFDPVGVRLKLDGRRVRVETYILPVIRSREYEDLRQLAGGAGVPAGVSPPTGRTVVQMVGYLSPTARERQSVGQLAGSLGGGPGAQWLGDWWVLRFDDSPVYGQLYELGQRSNPGRGEDAAEWLSLVSRMPVTFGVEIRNPLTFAGVLTALRTSALKAVPGWLTWEPLEPVYKGASIVRVQATRQAVAQLQPGAPRDREPAPPALYYALVDGVWYVSLQEQPIRDMIDRAADRKDKPAAAPEGPNVNSRLYVAPAAAPQTLPLVRAYLEEQSRRRALANAPVWYAFERSGLLAGRDDAGRRAVVQNYLGYVPVSPEGAPYRYDPRPDEVVNARHGSPRRPTPHKGVEPDSPLGRLLDQVRTLGVDLRFREDGIHTTITLERK